MDKIIKHSGVVQSIDGMLIRVKIVQTSACAACSAKGLCSSAESKEKTVDIFDKDANNYSVGDQVDIIGTTSLGLQAVWWAFGIPFVLIILTLFVSFALTDGNESLSGIISILSLIPYYIFLYFYRDKMAKKFSFKLKPINN